MSIIDRSDHWNVLLLKEALCIKQLKPVLNYGLMALQELELFAQMFVFFCPCTLMMT